MNNRTHTYLFDNKVTLGTTGVLLTFTITDIRLSSDGLGPDEVEGDIPLVELHMLEGVAVTEGKVSGMGGGNISITVTCCL